MFGKLGSSSNAYVVPTPASHQMKLCCAGGFGTPTMALLSNTIRATTCNKLASGARSGHRDTCDTSISPVVIADPRGGNAQVYTVGYTFITFSVGRARQRRGQRRAVNGPTTPRRWEPRPPPAPPLASNLIRAAPGVRSLLNSRVEACGAAMPV